MLFRFVTLRQTFRRMSIRREPPPSSRIHFGRARGSACCSPGTCSLLAAQELMIHLELRAILADDDTTDVVLWRGVRYAAKEVTIDESTQPKKKVRMQRFQMPTERPSQACEHKSRHLVPWKLYVCTLTQEERVSRMWRHIAVLSRHPVARVPMVQSERIFKHECVQDLRRSNCQRTHGE